MIKFDPSQRESRRHNAFERVCVEGHRQRLRAFMTYSIAFNISLVARSRRRSPF